MANKRWSIAVVLGLGVLVNYFDRVNLSVAHGALRNAFGMSDVVYGYMLSSYSWTYAAMQLPSGTLLDRWGVRRVMLAAILLWALASGLAALAPTILLLFAARFLLGIGEAPTFPANAKAVGLWFAEHERAIPTATFDSAAKLSIGIGTPFLGLILLHYGLRANFTTTAVLSLAYAGLFALLYRDPALNEGYLAVTSPATITRSVTLSELLHQRKVWGVAIGSGAYNYCFYLLLTWLPVYLESGVKMSAHAAVVEAGIPWILAAVAEFLIGGLLVDRLIRSGRNADIVRRTVLIAGTSLGLFIFAPALLHQPRVILVCLSLAVCGLSVAAPVVWTIPSLLAPPGGTGRVGAIMNLAGQLAAITAPIATGYLRTATHSFGPAFSIAGVALVFGIASYVFLLGKIERVPLST
jgi:MFS family permease